MIVIERIFFLSLIIFVLLKFTAVSELLMPQDNEITDLFYNAYFYLMCFIVLYSFITAISLIKAFINFFRD